jgi:signal transduction histidine kinase
VKTFRYTLRVAGLLVLFMLLVLLSISTMFRFTVGRPFHGRLRELLATESLLITVQLEGRIDDLELRDPGVARHVREVSSWTHRDIAVLDARGAIVAASSRTVQPPDDTDAEEVVCGDRRCRVFLAPPHASVVSVPLVRGGRERGTVLVDQSMPRPDEANLFLIGMISIGAVGLLGVALLSLYLSRPLRRMSRSMDRIASGDLAHRVAVKGRDEVACMGESFNTMADRVSTMIRGQQELLAGVSHELRSPLARMKLCLELLGGATDDQKKERHISSLTEDIDEVDSLVEELMTASRLDLGTATLRPERASLDDLVSAAWTRVEREAVDRGVSLTCSLEPPDVLVLADRALTVRLLGNLFENAVRHAPGSSVVVRARRGAVRVDVDVIDDGPGVAPEMHEKLFEPFFRADPSRSRRTGGSGLGLMIVRRAVEAQGGTCRASASSPGGGLTISFDLAAA